MKLLSKKRIILSIFPIIICFLLYAYVYSISNDIIDYSVNDILAEAVLAFLAFTWIIISISMVNKLKIFIPLYSGFLIILLGMVEDVLDELYEFEPLLYITSVENIIWVGMAVAAYGFFRWKKEVVEKDELIIKNKELLEIKSRLEKKNRQLKNSKDEIQIHKQKLKDRNKELEKTLDDFYTMRLGVQKQIKEGTIEEENRKIKDRLEKLKSSR